MTAPTNTPAYFDSTFPMGIKDWFSRVFFRVASFALRWIVKHKKSIKSPFSDTIIVTGFDLAQEVFSRDADFPTPNDTKTDVLQWNPPFLLAIRHADANYQLMHKQTRAIFADEQWSLQLPSIAYNAFYSLLPPPQDEWAQIDLAWEYMYPGFFKIIDDYYGIDFPDEDEKVRLVCGLLVVSAFFFSKAQAGGGSPSSASNQGAAPLSQKQLDAIDAFNDIWAIISRRIQHYQDPQNQERGCLEIALSLTPRLSLDELTSYFLGMIMGFVPTNGNGHARIAEVLFKNPTAYAWAEKYGVGVPDPQDDGEFLSVLHEALRMNYILPALWRVSVANTSIGANTPHARHIPPGFNIAVSGMAAMFDPDHMEKPKEFRPNRSYWGYLNYGHQLHFCVGWDLSNTIMVEYFRALIVRKFRLRKGGKNKLRNMFPWCIDIEYRAPDNVLVPLPGPGRNRPGPGIGTGVGGGPGSGEGEEGRS